MISTKYELIQRIEKGETFEFQGFIKGVFSNWFLAQFTVDDATYCCSEQYFMAEKARLFNDTDTLEKILLSVNPKEIKDLGRKVKNFDIGLWAIEAGRAMYLANLYKFRQNETMKKTLLNTGDKVLVECSPVDKLWGAGIPMNDPRLSRPEEWPGQNRLGFTLMHVRDKLKEE